MRAKVNHLVHHTVTVHFLHFLMPNLFPPSRSQLSDWLQKRDSHPIMELSYLEVGLGSQSIHVEFGDGGVAYTLLVRDSSRCKRFFGLLTGKKKQCHIQAKYFFLSCKGKTHKICFFEYSQLSLYLVTLVSALSSRCCLIPV